MKYCHSNWFFPPPFLTRVNHSGSHQGDAWLPCPSCCHPTASRWERHHNLIRRL